MSDSLRYAFARLAFFAATGLAFASSAQSNLGRPRVVMVVEAADSAAQQMATRLFMIAREQLHRTHSLILIDRDRRLGARREGRSTAKRARTLYDEGRKAYDMLELKEAIGLLKHASRELESRLGELQDRRLYTDIHTYLGSALVLVGNKQEGREVYRKLLAFNDQAELNPMVFPPELTAVFEQTADLVRRSGVGGLDIQVLPEGTEVWVDCIFRGFSPVKLNNLSEGEHILRLVRRGHHSQGWKQDIQADRTELIQLGMEPLPGFGKFQRVARRIVERADSVGYPDGVDTLTRKMHADRLLLFVVGGGGESVVRAYYYDRNFRTCLKSATRAFSPDDPSCLEQLGLFVTSMTMNVGGPETVPSEPVVSSGHIPEPSEETGEPVGSGDREEESSSIFTSWWFWTTVGVLVAGGAGLTLALTLGGSEPVPAAEVIFKF